MRQHRRNLGSALVIAVLLLVALIGIVFAMELASPASAAQRDRVSGQALAQAREALIAHAADHPINAVVGPGYLPCPDLDDDGWAEATCGSLAGDSGQADRLGRLPWKTLGIADLRDGYGERLWYAVSSKYKGLLNCGASRGCVDMTPEAALGTITVRDNAGTVIHDGTVAEAYRAVAGGAVAVIIAPGPRLTRIEAAGAEREQVRECAVGDCDSAGRCVTSPPQRAAHCDPANFLDRAPGARFGDEDNAAFVDRNDAPGRSRNRDGFIQGPVVLADSRVAVNDRIAVVGYRDVMPRIRARVALEAAHCLRQYASRPENGGRLPWPTPACLQATGSWEGRSGVLFGRIADTPFAGARQDGMLERWWRSEPRLPENLFELPTANSACRIAVAPADEGTQRTLPPANPADEGHTAGRDSNSWWNPWKRYVFYALARDYAPGAAAGPCQGASCLELVDASGRVVAGAKRFAVIVAGAPAVRDGFVQSRAGAAIGEPRQWLEEGNARLEGAAGCAVAPSFPCDGLGVCNRVNVGAPSAGFNDVVFAFP